MIQNPGIEYKSNKKGKFNVCFLLCFLYCVYFCINKLEKFSVRQKDIEHSQEKCGLLLSVDRGGSTLVIIFEYYNFHEF